MQNGKKEALYQKNSTSFFFSITDKANLSIKNNPALKEQGIMQNGKSCESDMDNYNLEHNGIKRNTPVKEKEHNIREMVKQATEDFEESFGFSPEGIFANPWEVAVLDEKMSLANKFANPCCPVNVHKDFCFNPPNSKPKGNKRKDWFELCPELTEYATKRKVLFKVLGKMFDRFCEDAPYFAAQDTKGIWFFSPHQKGSPSYNRELRDKIFAYSEIFGKDYPHKIGITLTVDGKKLPKDYWEMTKYVLEEKQKFIKFLERKFDMRHITVPEFQKNGTIHFHGILFFKERLWEEKDLRKAKDGHKYIKYGKWRKVMDWWKHVGFYDSQPCEGENVASYICKYISKETDSSLAELARKNAHGKKDIKTILQFVVPKVLGFDTFCHSEKKDGSKEKVDNILAKKKADRKAFAIKRHFFKNASKFTFKPYITKAEVKEFSCKRKSLIVIKALPRTKSEVSPMATEGSLLDTVVLSGTSQCMKTLYSSPLREFYSEFGADTKVMNDMPGWKKEKLLSHFKPVGCGCCIFGMYKQDRVYGTNETFRKFDFSEQLKPYFWRALKKRKTYFKDSLETEWGEEELYTMFEEITEEMGVEIFQPNKKELRYKSLKKKQLFSADVFMGGDVSLQEWQVLLAYRPQLLALVGNSYISRACRNFHSTFREFDESLADWQGTNLTPLFELYKGWLKENGFIIKK